MELAPCSCRGRLNSGKQIACVIFVMCDRAAVSSCHKTRRLHVRTQYTAQANALWKDFHTICCDVGKVCNEAIGTGLCLHAKLPTIFAEERGRPDDGKKSHVTKTIGGSYVAIKTPPLSYRESALCFPPLGPCFAQYPEIARSL